MLADLTFEELSNLSVFANMRIEDIQFENQRRQALNVSRGEFEDLAARVATSAKASES